MRLALASPALDRFLRFHSNFRRVDLSKKTKVCSVGYVLWDSRMSYEYPGIPTKRYKGYYSTVPYFATPDTIPVVILRSWGSRLQGVCGEFGWAGLFCSLFPI